jgi:hypothetical protein
MTEFGDIDKAKADKIINARIKAALMLLFQMFTGARNNTANMIQNFIPHLKRTDRDISSLPFFGKAYVSHKTNREHILLTKISMIVQNYWKLVSDKPELGKNETAEFLAELELIEQIAKKGFDNYRVFGVFPKFTLLDKAKIDLLEVEDVKKERAEAEKAEEREQQARKDEAEGKNLMAAELDSGGSTSDDSDSTDAVETEDVPLADESGATNGDSESAGNQPSAEETIPSAPEAASSKAPQPKDELSTEEADACGGDCDDCDNGACQTNQTDVTLDTDGTGIVDDESEVVENIPGSLADEQGGTTIPPMPEEEKDYQAAVDHETGDDQADDDGDSQAAVVDNETD